MKKNLAKTAKKLEVSPKTLQLYIEKIKKQCSETEKTDTKTAK